MRTNVKSLLGAALLLAACGDDAPEADEPREDAAVEVEPSRDAAVGSRDASVARDAAAPKDAAALDAGQTPEGEDASAPLDAGKDTPKDASTPDATPGDPGARPGYRIVWQDEFDGAKGSSPDAKRWVFETGGGGFGNNELEYYTSRPENASLDGDGKLVITARAEAYMGSKYTSARLKTAGKFERSYGRFEARLKLPGGQGIWPAFWMLGANIGPTPWPDCGEIDIMENVGKEPTLVHGTLHGPGYSGGNGIGKSYELPSKAAFTADFHVFAVEWEQNEIRWYVDDTLYQTRKPSDLPAGKKWVFDHDFFVLLNLAVGGQWPGSPDGTTKFPQSYSIDYVRVYERE